MKKLFLITLFVVAGVAIYSHYSNATDAIVLYIVDALEVYDADTESTESKAESKNEKGSASKLIDIKKSLKTYNVPEDESKANEHKTDDTQLETTLVAQPPKFEENVQPSSQIAKDVSDKPIEVAKKAPDNSLEEKQPGVKKEGKKMFLEEESAIEKYQQQGCEKLDKGDLKGAIKDFDKVISMDSENAEAYYKRGIAKQKLNENRGALNDLEKAIKLEPSYKDELQPAIEQARAMIKKDYDKAIKLNPNNAQAYYMRGYRKYQRGDDEGALADFDKAISLNPNYAMAYYNRGIVKYRLERYSSAIDDWQKAIKLQPSRRNEIQHWIDLAKQK